ncbi:putative biotin--acetyl-CoA-carboxylase ligase [Agromyces rhizosphaerae]|uniref:biotin--[biotin carboxyl-carrier protein] ligase n=1 Tax=Agromyces rhizosphaerae TaxID=88374 RepID=A0A9W6CPG2_9MICO|nr:biotin--[acetyl-CoA-carboxylase] ligase [Agromyces rhizosphaerae]GLI26113.1 putative biotin--acetyl-CoA-carboxylase ligase [Agromyces rhizosphaerae]
MEFPLSRAAVPRFLALDEAGSTNDELAARARSEASDWPDLSVVVTDDQTRGRGRLGRTWLAPSGKSLAISILLRPRLPGGGELPPDALGWLPLLAGAAMTRAVRAAVLPAADADAGPEEPAVIDGDGTGGVDVWLKWPNDVLISGYKVCGILSELLADQHAVLVGSGLNVSLDEHDLPTLTSTSLSLVTHAPVDADAVLVDYLGRFTALYRAFLDAGADARASGLADEVAGLCGTLGTRVRVELPGGEELVGVAASLDDAGRLIVQDEADEGRERAVAAGDVTHLRY